MTLHTRYYSDVFVRYAAITVEWTVARTKLSTRRDISVYSYPGVHVDGCGYDTPNNPPRPPAGGSKNNYQVSHFFCVFFLTACLRVAWPWSNTLFVFVIESNSSITDIWPDPHSKASRPSYTYYIWTYCYSCACLVWESNNVRDFRTQAYRTIIIIPGSIGRSRQAGKVPMIPGVVSGWFPWWTVVATVFRWKHSYLKEGTCTFIRSSRDREEPALWSAPPGVVTEYNVLTQEEDTLGTPCRRNELHRVVCQYIFEYTTSTTTVN